MSSVQAENLFKGAQTWTLSGPAPHNLNEILTSPGLYSDVGYSRSHRLSSYLFPLRHVSIAPTHFCLLSPSFDAGILNCPGQNSPGPGFPICLLVAVGRVILGTPCSSLLTASIPLCPPHTVQLKGHLQSLRPSVHAARAFRQRQLPAEVEPGTLSVFPFLLAPLSGAAWGVLSWD